MKKVLLDRKYKNLSVSGELIVRAIKHTNQHLLLYPHYDCVIIKSTLAGYNVGEHDSFPLGHPAWKLMKKDQDDDDYDIYEQLKRLLQRK